MFRVLDKIIFHYILKGGKIIVLLLLRKDNEQLENLIQNLKSGKESSITLPSVDSEELINTRKELERVSLCEHIHFYFIS